MLLHARCASLTALTRCTWAHWQSWSWRGWQAGHSSSGSAWLLAFVPGFEEGRVEEAGVAWCKVGVVCNVEDWGLDCTCTVACKAFVLCNEKLFQSERSRNRLNSAVVQVLTRVWTRSAKCDISMRVRVCSVLIFFYTKEESTRCLRITVVYTAVTLMASLKLRVSPAILA